MTENDLRYLESIIDYIQSPCLELGAEEQGLEAESKATKVILKKHGIEHHTTNLQGSVDYIADFETNSPQIADRFGSILALNVLEHVFDPIKVLDNCISLLRTEGTCVVIVPCVWPLHYYPLDCWRINPGFFVEYARRRNLTLIEDAFRYVTGELLTGPEFALPVPGNGFKRFWSRAIHKVFNTYGRGMFFPSHVAVGVVLQTNQRSTNQRSSLQSSR